GQIRIGRGPRAKLLQPMGDRPTGPRAPRPPMSPSASPAPPGSPPQAGPATAARPAPLPPVFWGALGCVSVLGVGFTMLFLLARPGGGPAAAPVAPPPSAAAAPARAPE